MDTTILDLICSACRDKYNSISISGRIRSWYPSKDKEPFSGSFFQLSPEERARWERVYEDNIKLISDLLEKCNNPDEFVKRLYEKLSQYDESRATIENFIRQQWKWAQKKKKTKIIIKSIHGTNDEGDEYEDTIKDEKAISPLNGAELSDGDEWLASFHGSQPLVLLLILDRVWLEEQIYSAIPGREMILQKYLQSNKWLLSFLCPFCSRKIWVEVMKMSERLQIPSLSVTQDVYSERESWRKILEMDNNDVT